MGDITYIKDYDLGTVGLRSDGIPVRCTRCSWYESSRCYNEKIAIVTKCVGMRDALYVEWVKPKETKGNLVEFLENHCFSLRGQLITLDLYRKCHSSLSAEAYLKEIKEIEEEFKKPEPVLETVEEDGPNYCTVCGSELDGDEEKEVCWDCYEERTRF